MKLAATKWSLEPGLRLRARHGRVCAGRWPPSNRSYQHLNESLAIRRSFSATAYHLETSPTKSSGDPSPQRQQQQQRGPSDARKATQGKSTATASNSSSSKGGADGRPNTPPADWDENPNFSISKFSDLPSANFGVNQHMIINTEFKEALRQILWQFRAPIRYAFAYGSGVFPQNAKSPSSSGSSIHPNPSKAVTNVQGHPGKMVDFIFGVSFTQHWHSLNLQQHRDHYSAIGSLGSGLVKRVQDRWGAGVYFNPYITVNGTLIKYGVVNLDTLCTDLSQWNTLYLAGRLHKPVKILRDDPRVRLANQVNLLSAVRTALLLLPDSFTEKELYTAIANISYLGDPRMSLPGEDRNKVSNIVNHQLTNFRQLYKPLIDNLPNINFTDSRCTSDGRWADDSSIDAKLQQDMDPVRRGNMVRRLPKTFRSRLYFQYQAKFGIPGGEFAEMMERARDEDAQGNIKRQQGGEFERRMASDDRAALAREVGQAIKKTSSWPATSQSIKSFFTAGVSRSLRYMREKSAKYKAGQAKEAAAQQQQKKEKKQEDKQGKGKEGIKGLKEAVKAKPEKESQESKDARHVKEVMGTPPADKARAKAQEQEKAEIARVEEQKAKQKAKQKAEMEGKASADGGETKQQQQ